MKKVNREIHKGGSRITCGEHLVMMKGEGSGSGVAGEVHDSASERCATTVMRDLISWETLLIKSEDIKILRLALLIILTSQ